jgi:predicted MFS family arabinose efflux permease
MRGRRLLDWPARLSHAWTVLGLCSVAYFSIRLGQLVIGPLAPAITETFPVSSGAVGGALSLMWGTYALVQLPSGALADRFGGAWTVRLALALASVCCLLLTMSPSFDWFAVAVGLLGVGAGLYYNAATGLLVDVADQIGFAIGTHRGGSKVAGLVAPALAVAVTAAFGWRATFVVTAGLALVGLGVFAAVVPASRGRSPADSTVGLSGVSDGLSTLRRPRIAYTTGLLATGEFVGQATMTFLSVFLVTYQGLTLSQASVLFTVLFVASGVAQPVMGRLSDRIGREPTVAVSAALGGTGYLVLVASDTLPVLLVGTAVAGWSQSWTAPLQSAVFDHLDEEARDTGFGTVRTAYLLVGATGSVATGVIADTYGWAAAFGSLGTLLGIVCAVIVANLLRTRWL